MIPHLKTMVEKLKNRPFALLGINSDEDRDVLKDKKEAQRYSEIFTLAPLLRARLPAEDQALLVKAHTANIAYLQKILKEQGIRWRQAVQESTRGPIPKRWNVHSWPTIYVIDASGKIRSKDLHGQELEDAVMRLLDEMTPPAPKK